MKTCLNCRYFREFQSTMFDHISYYYCIKTDKKIYKEYFNQAIYCDYCEI